MAASAVLADVKHEGATVTYTVPAQKRQAATIDFANAKPMPLPQARSRPPSPTEAARQATAPSSGTPGVSPGVPGNGGPASGSGASAALQAEEDDEVESQEFGTSNHPFTTNRVDAKGGTITQKYPFRPTGKLYFNIGSSTYVCSAALIKRGLIVTAAHCVANYGASQFYSNWQFKPAHTSLSSPNPDPYGTWAGVNATILTKYYTGTDGCYVYGVVCPDDVAVITLAPQSGAYPGTTTGWYGYGWDGWGFNPSGQTLVNQLGYPVALDGGHLMQRNDSQGFKNATFSNNTIIGSLMTGGSSGGPWLNNLGIAPVLSGTGFGSYATRNIVVGVTSWGYTNTAVKQQGASPFTSGNITVIVNAACAGSNPACS